MLLICLLPENMDFSSKKQHESAPLKKKKKKIYIKCGIILILMIDLYIIDVNSIIQMHTLYHI